MRGVRVEEESPVEGGRGKKESEGVSSGDDANIWIRGERTINNIVVFEQYPLAVIKVTVDIIQVHAGEVPRIASADCLSLYHKTAYSFDSFAVLWL